MDADRWRRLRTIFDLASDAPPAERERILDAACGSDVGLRAEAAALILAAESPHPFLRQPAAQLMVRVAEGSVLCERFRILRSIGSGGMGDVWAAHDQHLDERIAIKSIRPALMADGEGWVRFKREIQLARRIAHPNVCRVYELFEDASTGQPLFFLTMELLEGESLSARLHRDGPIPVPEALDLFTQICAGLAAAHAADVVHRDLKPSNIMVTPSADRRAVIMDFGLARAGADSPTNNLTTPGAAAVGTPQYMSPEQMRGEAPTPAADVYALGLTLYEMLRGRGPFAGVDTLDSWLRLAREVPEHMRDLSLDVGPRLEHVLARCLEFEPRKRFQTAAEVLEVLRTPAASPSDGERPARSATPRRPGRAPSRSRSKAVCDQRRSTVIMSGRELELSALREAFAAAASGRGRAACLAAEAGVGKSALVQAFLAELEPSKATPFVAVGCCSQVVAGTEAYTPILEALESLLKGQSRNVAEKVMVRVAPTWYVQLRPALRRENQSDSLNIALRAASPERLKRELATLFEELAEMSPLVLVLEDIHWSDHSTIDLIGYVGARIEHTRAMVIVTYRPSELERTRSPFVPLKLELQARGVCTELRLPMLRIAEVAAYLDACFPGNTFPSDFLTIVFGRTEGYPLFVAELLRELHRSGVIQKSDRGWTLGESWTEFVSRWPESVRSMIARKLQSLDACERELLSFAAVQGERFRAAIVADVANIAEMDVEDQLQRIEHRHALVERAGEEDLGDGRVMSVYRFCHALFQSALVESMSGARRISACAATATACVKRFGPGVSVIEPTVAVLFEAGRRFADAAEHFAAAARAATKVLAFHEAKLLAEHGLSAIEHLPSGEQRDRLELSLQLALFRPLKALSGYASEQVEAVCARVFNLSRKLSAERETFHVLSGFCIVHQTRGEVRQALKLAQECQMLAEQSGDPVFRAQAHWQMGQNLLYAGEWLGARREFEACLSIYDPDKHHRALLEYGLGDGPAVGLANLSRVLWSLGYADQARTTIARAIALHEQLHDPYTSTLIFTAVGYVAVCLREPDLVETSAAAIEKATRGRNPYLAGVGSMFAAWAMADRGNTTDACELFERGLNTYSRAAKANMTAFFSIWIDILLRRGDLSRARQVLEQAKATAEHTGERMLEPELHRMTAEIAWRSVERDNAIAEEEFRRAIALAQTQLARAWELRASVGLARHLLRQGRDDEAREHLGRIVATFGEGLETRDMRDARTLLEPARTIA